jgi:hypothetical protein
MIARPGVSTMADNITHLPASARQSSRDSHGRFQTGNIGGPGRPKGSRNKLGEDFISAIYEDWTEHGAAVLKQVRQTSPSAYLRVVASIVPQHSAITEDDDLSEMSDRELRESTAELLEEMGMPEGARAVRSKIGS